MDKLKISCVLLFWVVFFLCCSKNLYSQQLPLYSEYMFNTIEINPAYAGFRDAIQITSMFRKKWTGFKTAPQSTFLSIDMPVANKRIGLGLKIVDDRDEVSTSLGVQSTYSFKVPLDENTTLALGLQGGVISYKADLTQLDVIDANDPSFSQNSKFLRINFGAGAFFNTEKFYAGLSTPNLIRPNFRKDFSEASTPYKQNMHFYFNTGYIFTLSHNLHVKPSILLRGVQGSPLSIDFNVNLWITEALSLGASYRMHNAIVGIIDLQIVPNLRIGYAYDYNTSRFNLISKGSHEVILRYEIPLGNKAPLMPRYF